MPSCLAPKRFSNASQAATGSCVFLSMSFVESTTRKEISINADVLCTSQSASSWISVAVGLAGSTQFGWALRSLGECTVRGLGGSRWAAQVLAGFLSLMLAKSNDDI